MIHRKSHPSLIAFLAVFAAFVCGPASAALPQFLNHQGRVAVQGVNFDGNGLFKFALVNAEGTLSYWSNDGTSVAGGQPAAVVTLAVNKGLYAVLLGNPGLPNMTVIPPSALEHEDIRLRVWFNDGSRGFQQITPDQRFAAVPYAIHAREALTAETFGGLLAGDVTGAQSTTAIADATVTGKRLTGFASGTGLVSADDSLLSAIGKLHGNASLLAPLESPTFTGTVSGISAGMVGLGNVSNTSDANKPVSTAQQAALTLKANLASPTFTGTVSGISAGMVGLGNVSNTSDANKPVSTAQQAALTLKANLASPTFTGTVSGISAGMVGLGNVSNTSDANKPVSTAQQAALTLKANLASPAFTGTVLLPAGSSSSAPLQFATGASLTTPVFGSVEFDGTNLYLTTNSSTPTRKAVVLSDSGSSAQVPLASVVAAPLKPVVAWGENTYGQVTVPSLANVANIACGNSHSLALLDSGSVLAWGLNTKGQTTVPSAATGVTEIAAGAEHNLVRKSDGTLIAWGNNGSGQCTVPVNIDTATKVAAGANHSLALLANGSLRAWGDNYWGQTTIPSSLSGVTVTAIAAGYDHSLALTSAGAVVAWGRGGEADGLGQNVVPAEAASGVIAIAAGAYHSLALKSNGTVVAWGWDLAGQVTAPASWSGITKIAGGYGFSLGLKSDGTLVSGGDTTKGQATFPADATQIASIAAGANHALALRTDSIPAQVARLDQDNVFTGKVGIQRTPATNALEVNGNASKSIAGSWLSNSDLRIKADIESISGALEKLDQVRLVDFRYHQDYLAAHPEIVDRRYPNVIAQEFAQVFPDDVKSSGEILPDGSEILQVDTYPLTIYSAAAIQELHRENRLLQKKIDEQEKRLRKLEELIKNS
jgi:alpha-tubulin suppressor-like RCC1 family protein